MTAVGMFGRTQEAAATGAPDWEREGLGWPNRSASRFIAAGGLRWHVQIMGEGPVMLLVHGTGAATHSWRSLLPLLARRFTVVAPDMPGHGFTERPASAQLSMEGMAASLAALVKVLGIAPDVAVGHSAGAAVLARMCLAGSIAPRLLISLNGALLPLVGLPGHIFAPAAKLLAMVPGVPWFFARHGSDRATVERLLRDTGSRIDAEGVDLYQRLVRCPGHVAAALGMMAHWDLDALERELPKLKAPLLLISGEKDSTVPAEDSRRVARIVAGARVVIVPRLGHLAHEEAPEALAELILAEAA